MPIWFSFTSTPSTPDFCHMQPKRYSFLLFVSLLFLLGACSHLKKTGSNRPGTTQPTPSNRKFPMDTVRWVESPAFPPAIGTPDANDQVLENADPPGTQYRLSVVLPFLSKDASGGSVPEKSKPALQFYAGAKLAFASLSETSRMNLKVNVIDSYVNDFDFTRVIQAGKLDDAQMLIGPVRNSHLSALAKRAKGNRQVVLSPLSPSSELVSDFPGFIQFNPSLKSHCAAITKHVRSKYRADQVVLICKEKEASRLPYFQEANAAFGPDTLRSILVPDEGNGMNSISLGKYIRSGRTTVFIMPSWAGQDFIMSFLFKLKAAKGSNRVEVYGMPQWAGYEDIEPEYLRDLNVHISSADYVDRKNPDVIQFEKAFFEAYGTIAGEDAIAGYDAALFAGRMLNDYGLSFPEKLDRISFSGLRGSYVFKKVHNESNSDAFSTRYDYMENTRVTILKFEGFRFVDAAGLN
jgi:hypothetical protein